MLIITILLTWLFLGSIGTLLAYTNKRGIFYNDMSTQTVVLGLICGGGTLLVELANLIERK